MNRKRKIEIVTNIITLMDKATCFAEYAKYKSQLVHEIISSGFKNSELEIIESSIKTWGEDLDREFMSRIQNTDQQFSSEYTKLSKTGLINLINLSALPE